MIPFARDDYKTKSRHLPNIPSISTTPERIKPYVHPFLL